MKYLINKKYSVYLNHKIKIEFDTETHEVQQVMCNYLLDFFI